MTPFNGCLGEGMPPSCLRASIHITNEAEGRAILEGSDVVYAPSMEAGAAKVVELTA